MANMYRSVFQLKPSLKQIHAPFARTLTTSRVPSYDSLSKSLPADVRTNLTQRAEACGFSEISTEFEQTRPASSLCVLKIFKIQKVPGRLASYTSGIEVLGGGGDHQSAQLEAARMAIDVLKMGNMEKREAQFKDNGGGKGYFDI